MLPEEGKGWTQTDARRIGARELAKQATLAFTPGIAERVDHVIHERMTTEVPANLAK
jgi:hypothetical protein